MSDRYIREAMERGRYKTLDDGTWFGEISGLAGVWANERTLSRCQEVLQEVLEEWLILKKELHARPPGVAISCYDLARDLAGSVRGRPADLADNPKYMDGFGS